MRLISDIAPIREHVFASRVAMKIDHKIDFSISSK